MSQSTARPRSLVFTMLAAAVLFGIGMPAIHWLAAAIFNHPAPLVSVGHWARFAAAMAVVGACAGAAAYRLRGMPPGWLRSYVAGILFSLALAGDPEEFARYSLVGWVIHVIVLSLVMGLVSGAVFHWLAFRDRRDPAP